MPLFGKIAQLSADLRIEGVGPGQLFASLKPDNDAGFGEGPVVSNAILFMAVVAPLEVLV
jgi:hypothetical protein